MKRRLTLAILLLTSASAFGKTAPLKSAKELETTCTTAMSVFEHANDTAPLTQEASAYGQCIGYVEAVLDSMRSLKQIGNDGKTYKFHLHGDGFTTEDAIVFFLDFCKKNNKSDQNGPAAEIVIRALTAKHLVTTSVVDERPKH